MHVGQNAYQALTPPVLQHLPYHLSSYVGPLHGNALLQCLLKGEGYVQTLEDGIILAASCTVVTRLTAITL